MTTDPATGSASPTHDLSGLLADTRLAMHDPYTLGAAWVLTAQSGGYVHRLSTELHMLNLAQTVLAMAAVIEAGGDTGPNSGDLLQVLAHNWCQLKAIIVVGASPDSGGEAGYAMMRRDDIFDQVAQAMHDGFSVLSREPLPDHGCHELVRFVHEMPTSDALERLEAATTKAAELHEASRHYLQ